MKLPFWTALRNVDLVGEKQHPWKYWMSSLVVVSFFIITFMLCRGDCLDMGTSHSPSVLFLSPLGISFLFWYTCM